MTLKAQSRLLSYFLSKKEKEEEGFTLVELIVVVVIIGILSSIAIPSFQNAADKAKQQEASVLISSYVKAVQAYYAEFSILPTKAAHLGEYISIFACAVTDPNTCKDASARAMYIPRNTRKWISSSGLYDIALGRSGQNISYLTALPAGNYSSIGRPVTGCFNGLTGAVKIVLHTTKGRRITSISC